MPRASLDHDPLIYASHCSWNDRHVPPCSTFISWDRFSHTFLQGWTGTAILLSARITDVSLFWCHTFSLDFCFIILPLFQNTKESPSSLPLIIFHHHHLSLSALTSQPPYEVYTNDFPKRLAEKLCMWASLRSSFPILIACFCSTLPSEVYKKLAW
jgi:hypothetical protein